VHFFYFSPGNFLKKKNKKVEKKLKKKKKIRQWDRIMVAHEFKFKNESYGDNDDDDYGTLCSFIYHHKTSGKNT